MQNSCALIFDTNEEYMYTHPENFFETLKPLSTQMLQANSEKLKANALHMKLLFKVLGKLNFITVNTCSAVYCDTSNRRTRCSTSARVPPY